MTNKRPFHSHKPKMVASDVPSSTFVTHGELIRLAEHRRCSGIETEPVLALCRPEKNFWVFKATVYESAHCRGFVGYGA